MQPAAIATGQFEQRPDSLSAWVYNAIRQAIIDGRIPPGSPMTEAALAKQMNVSKTPVREALLRLREIGLIESYGPRAGRIVTPSLDQLRDSYETRCALETASARLAAQRGDRETLLAAQKQAKATVAAAKRRDIVKYREADESFHSLIGVASGNRKLAHMIDDINALISTLRMRTMPGIDASPLCASQHLNISEALLSGDAETAERLMAEHVTYVSSEVLRAFADLPVTAESPTALSSWRSASA